jgi:hypothetical protein
MPWLLLGLVAIALAAPHLYPWALRPEGDWTRIYARPTFVRAWLTPAFFTVRLVVYAFVWWWLARPESLATKGRVAASFVAYAIATTLAAVDLIMSLLPAWYSTGFGLLVMSSQALSGAAAATLFACSRAPRGWPGAGPVPVTRDLGNLLLMWTMSWGYLAFMQFIVIWAENLPREIAWYVPRLQTGWQWVGLALVFTQLALPFFALLWRSMKDRPERLARVAMLMLASSALDAAWMVIPSVDAHSLHALWLPPLAFGGIGLLLFGGLGVPVPAAANARPRHA